MQRLSDAVARERSSLVRPKVLVGVAAPRPFGWLKILKTLADLSGVGLTAREGSARAPSGGTTRVPNRYYYPLRRTRESASVGRSEGGQMIDRDKDETRKIFEIRDDRFLTVDPNRLLKSPKVMQDLKSLKTKMISDRPSDKH
jgi:hypothetical protein